MNQESGRLFLNDEDATPTSRILVEMGVAWQYTHNEVQEVLQAEGPLKYAVVLMVSERPSFRPVTVCASPT